MEKKPHLLPPPLQYHYTNWESEDIIEALEKSREALLNLSSSTSTSHQHHAAADSDDLLMKLFPVNVENLFLVHTTPAENGNERGISMVECYFPHGPIEQHRSWEWGSRDMMLDMSPAATTKQERMAIVTAAANLTDRAVHLFLNDEDLTEEKESGWVKAICLAADRDAGPSTLLIFADEYRDAHGFLSALKKNKRLKHLSLQGMTMSDECLEVLHHFTSLTTLQLFFVSLDKELVVELAELHPSHSPLAASLQRLFIDLPIDRRRSTGFLRHWPKLKELTLFSHDYMKQQELMDFMDLLAPPKTGVETAGSTPSSPPQLYSLLFRGNRGGHFSHSTIAAVVDALSRSGLPFFECGNLTNPAIKAQLWRNQRNYMLGSDLKRVPATSIRLFICGDPFAGKTTLVSTMRSIYGRKRDRLRALFTGERTKGIEVQAIKKKGIRVSLWDMAGQQEFHAFHDCMFPDIGTNAYQFPSMFMFVWSPMDSQSNNRGAEKKEADFETSLRYWLRFLASKSPQSIIPLKVILVFTRADQMDFISSSVSNSIDSLRSEFESVIDIVYPQFDVDARNKDFVKPVAERVFHIAKDVLQGIELYDICTQVSKNLLNYSKSTNERIITWEEFSKICNNVDKAKLNAIAMSLNESGNIIYINTIKYIILDPNWFCNEIMGSLIGFPNSKGSSKGTIVFDKGCIPRLFLEQKFESITKSKVKGSLLVDLMEAMHLCCQVPNSTPELIFIPAILPCDEPGEQLQWTSWTSKSANNLNDDKDTFVYMGRRLECENKDLTFFTPGLFPKIQMLFNNAFKSEDDNAHITLGKNFITICFPKSVIIVMFCQAKSNYVIDVLVRAQSINTEKDALSILAFMEKRIVNNVITICAQPTAVQGVRLIESVIRPDCCCDLSNAQDREDQCVNIAYLKKQLREKLKQNKQLSYDWKQTQLLGCLTNDFIDLLGFENYEEVLVSYKAWLKKEAQGLFMENDDVKIFGEQKIQQNVTMTSLENSLVEEDPILEDQAIEVQCTKLMVKEIKILHRKIDATHEVVLKIDDKIDQMTKMVDEMHKELRIMRKDVMSNIEKSIRKLLKMALENEAEKQLPRVALLTTISSASTVEELFTWWPRLLGGKMVRVQLYCEDKNLPHPVKNQHGITLTSLSESHSEYLEKALPYINGLFHVLSLAARLGVSSMVPLASSLIPDWTLHLKLAKEYPMIQNNFESKRDIYLSTLACASKEWQKCLASILRENGGLTDKNIAKKFHLKRTKNDEGGYAWLCKMHSEGKRFCPLG